MQAISVTDLQKEFSLSKTRIADLQNDIRLLKARIASLEREQSDAKKVIELLITAGLIDQEKVEMAKKLATSTRL